MTGTGLGHSQTSHFTTSLTPPGSVVERGEILALLTKLDAISKERANLVRSCKDRAETDVMARDQLAALLRALTEQRKRIRSVRRVLLALPLTAVPDDALRQATWNCVREEEVMGEALRDWSSRSLREVTDSLQATWRALSVAARQFL